MSFFTKWISVDNGGTQPNRNNFNSKTIIFYLPFRLHHLEGVLSVMQNVEIIKLVTFGEEMEGISKSNSDN